MTAEMISFWPDFYFDSTMSKHIGDIGKDAKDLITQDFPADGTVKLITQSKTPNGLTVKATLNRWFKKEKSGQKEIISAVIEPKYEWKERNIEFNGKLQTTNDFSAGFSLKDAAVKGTKIELTGANSDRDGTTVQVVGSYKTDTVATKINFSYPLSPKQEKTPVKLNGELVIQYPTSFFLGSTVAFDLDSINTWKGEGVVGYSQDDWQLTARGTHDHKEDSTIFGVSFFHKISDVARWALSFDADQAWTRGPICAVAADYKLDKATTLKGKWSVKAETSKQPEMRLGLTAKQQITPFFTASLGADLNLRNLLGESIGDAHSFGLELKLQD